MLQHHPEIIFDVSSKITGQITQKQSGISRLYFFDTSGNRMRLPPSHLKVYDKKARTDHRDPLGYRMPMHNLPDGSSYFNLSMTQNYEIYWKGKLAAELNFTWRVTGHHRRKNKKTLPVAPEECKSKSQSTASSIGSHHECRFLTDTAPITPSQGV